MALRIIPLTFCAIIISLTFSCDSTTNINKTDICGKKFTQSIQDSSHPDISTNSTTVFKCDGTFTSSQKTNLDDQSEVHQAEFHTQTPNFSGKWEIVTIIPENVKEAVREYGVKDDDKNYSIIKYSSSNGIAGYCIYQILETKGTINPLYTGQVSQSDWSNVAGAVGIFGGSTDN